VVQLVLAALAAQLAWGGSAEEPSTTGAVQALAEPAPGRVLVWVVCVGMAVLVVWQVFVAVDVRQGWASRVAGLGTAAAYAAVAVVAGRFAVGGRGSSSQQSGEQATRTLFDLPGGVWIVGLVGLAIAVVGLFLVVKGVTSGFVDDLAPGATGGTVGDGVIWLGRVGFAAKGAALGVVGALFVTAALTHDADEAGGLDQALATLKRLPAGPWLLTVVAIGLAAFGLYCFARARYERR
jgi:hypothetical protein